jgi:hypothetical protein
MRLLRFTFRNEAIWTLVFSGAGVLMGLVIFVAIWIVRQLSYSR